MATKATCFLSHVPQKPKVPFETRSKFQALCLVFPTVSAHKTFRTKSFLAKKQKQNHPVPHWIQMKTGNKITCSSKRGHWRTNLGL
ncbi:60S ribosomal protein L39-like [Ursus maritimus]|uniref:Large ribosomal subunit protein eL39 n=1 Tax=Ursus maritimus TaxID=29073 RepID=A0A8M1H1Q0_URSMA|nr:60S ribosomal protein L39-like [Ursus maritimus]